MSFLVYDPVQCTMPWQLRQSLVDAASVTYTYHDGGPLAAVWGWVAASLANLLMATAIAELVSAYPIAGGSYVWYLPYPSLI